MLLSYREVYSYLAEIFFRSYTLPKICNEHPFFLNEPIAAPTLSKYDAAHMPMLTMPFTDFHLSIIYLWTTSRVTSEYHNMCNKKVADNKFIKK